MEKYSIFDEEDEVGELELLPEGGYTRFRALCRSDRKGLLRLAAETEAGLCPVGVLLPGSGGWALDRLFSPGELREQGLTGLRRCFLLEDGVWQEEREPERLFQDRALQEVGKKMRGVRSRREGKATLLAVPLSGEQPFPAMPIFCFGEVEEIDGKDWVIFRIVDGELTLNSA